MSYWINHKSAGCGLKWYVQKDRCLYGKRKKKPSGTKQLQADGTHKNDHNSSIRNTWRKSLHEDILLIPEVCTDMFPECSVLLRALTPMILCCVGSPAALDLPALFPFILPSILWEEDGLNQSTYVQSTGTHWG